MKYQDITVPKGYTTDGAAMPKKWRRYEPFTFADQPGERYDARLTHYGIHTLDPEWTGRLRVSRPNLVTLRWRGSRWTRLKAWFWKKMEQDYNPEAWNV